MRTVISVLLAVLLLSPLSSFATRLKIFSYPKQIAAGQMGLLMFESSDPDAKIERSSCTAEKLLAWTKMDIPILRIEQNGKQVFMRLGSYISMEDSAIASFMVPVTLEAGEATLFILNGTEASVPYKFTVLPAMETKITKIENGSIKPLEKFRIIGEGFMQSTILEVANQIHELSLQIKYDGLSKGEQYKYLNKRIQNDWDRVPTGNFLYVEQGDKKWRIFVENCGITKDGLALEFTAPPDLTPGQATLTLALRYNKNDCTKSAAFTVTVQ